MTKALVILCGGLSTRMGSDKAFLPFGEKSLLRYQVERFRPFFTKIYLSIPKKEERPFDYEAYCGCTAIEDTYSKIGPMGGLYSCLKNIPEDILFFTSVDAPFTNASLAPEMCSLLENSKDRYACTIINYGGRVQPLFAAYTKECLDPLKDLIDNGTYKLKQLLKPEKQIIFEHFHPAEQFFNMNDPQSYYYGLSMLSKIRPSEFPPEFGNAGQNRDCIIPVLSFSAKSGTGKTTYIEKIISLLKEKHLRLAVIKHDAHGFEIDKPGKDSYRFTHAGADHMILTSENQTAMVITHKDQNPDLNTILSRIENVDFIITEGYKLGSQNKVQILRKGHNEEPVGNTDNTVAYVADFPYQTDLPLFDLNSPEQIIPFILKYIEKECHAPCQE